MSFEYFFSGILLSRKFVQIQMKILCEKLNIEKRWELSLKIILLRIILRMILKQCQDTSNFTHSFRGRQLKLEESWSCFKQIKKDYLENRAQQP